MEPYKRMCLLIGTLFSQLICTSECKKLDGYDFPVYTTNVCPRNETEWKERSSAINCTKTNGYLCVPNEELTELLEFCYIYPFIWIQEGVCLYLYKSFSRVNSYNCDTFLSGCPKSSIVSNRIFDYPNCLSIGHGCFLADVSCNISTTQELSSASNMTPSTTISFFKETTGTTKPNVEMGNINIKDNKECVIINVVVTGLSSLLLIVFVCVFHQRQIKAITYNTRKLCLTENEIEVKERNTSCKEISDESGYQLVRSDNRKDTLKKLHDECSVYISKDNKCGSNPLYVASGNGSIQYLMTNEEWFGPLYVACKNGRSDLAHRILNTDKYGNLHFSTQEGGSLILVASKNGHCNIVRLLLKYGVDVNFCNENGASPLYIACFNGHTKIVKLLLQEGADINLCSKSGISPLYVACQNEYKTIVNILLNNDADINLCDKYGTSPLSVACRNGYDNIVQLLLDYGADFCNVLKFPGLIGYESTTSLLQRHGVDA